MSKYILPGFVDMPTIEAQGITKSMGWLLALDLCAMFTKARFPLLISRARQVIDEPTKAVKRHFFHLSTPEGMLVIRIKQDIAKGMFYVTTEATEVKERGKDRRTFESGTLVGMTRAVKKAAPLIIGNTNEHFVHLYASVATDVYSSLYCEFRNGDTTGYHKVEAHNMAELVRALDSGIPNAPLSTELEEVLKSVRSAIANEKKFNTAREEFFQPTKWVVRYSTVNGTALSIGAVKMDIEGAIKEVVMPFKPYRSVEEFCEAYPESENDLIVGLKGVITNFKMNGKSTLMSVNSDDKFVLPVVSVHSHTWHECNIPFGYGLTLRQNGVADKSHYGVIVVDKVM
jgi:hypothetical protein